MPTTRRMKTTFLLLLCLCVGCGEKPKPAPPAKATTTYTVKTPVWETTNAIEVLPNHEPNCTLVRYVADGTTNEFHAWMVPVVVVTNTP